MKVPKFIKKAIAKHIDTLTQDELDELEKKNEDNSNEVRKKMGLTPSKDDVKENPEIRKLKEKIRSLEKQISDIFAQGGKEVILIRSDKGADVQKVLRLTDIARRLGIEKVSFAVKEAQ